MGDQPAKAEIKILSQWGRPNGRLCLSLLDPAIKSQDDCSCIAGGHILRPFLPIVISKALERLSNLMPPKRTYKIPHIRSE
jgi:hypothetical protein